MYILCGITLGGVLYYVQSWVYVLYIGQCVVMEPFSVCVYVCVCVCVCYWWWIDMLLIHSLPSESFQVHVPAYVLSLCLHKVYEFKYCIVVPDYINLRLNIDHSICWCLLHAYLESETLSLHTRKTLTNNTKLHLQVCCMHVHVYHITVKPPMKGSLLRTQYKKKPL